MAQKHHLKSLRGMPEWCPSHLYSSPNLCLSDLETSSKITQRQCSNHPCVCLKSAKIARWTRGKLMICCRSNRVAVWPAARIYVSEVRLAKAVNGGQPQFVVWLTNSFNCGQQQFVAWPTNVGSVVNKQVTNAWTRGNKRVEGWLTTLPFWVWTCWCAIKIQSARSEIRRGSPFRPLLRWAEGCSPPGDLQRVP